MMLAYIELDSGDWVRPDLIVGLSHDVRKDQTIVLVTGGNKFYTTLTANEVLERIDYAVKAAAEAEGVQIPERDTESPDDCSLGAGPVANTLADGGRAEEVGLG